MKQTESSKFCLLFLWVPVYQVQPAVGAKSELYLLFF